MSTSYVQYPAAGGGGGTGDVVGPASSPNDPGYAFPLALFDGSTGKLLKSYSDVWYWQDGTLTIKDLSLGGTGVVSKTGGQLLQYTFYGTYFMKDAINEPASSANIGVLAANGNHYPFVKGSMQSLHLGYDIGDASVAATAGTIKAKDGVPVLIAADFGVGFPNMTTAQKNAITSPTAGRVVFDTTLSKLCVYSGSAWETITSV
jgi:hypothetical protein